MHNTITHDIEIQNEDGDWHVNTRVVGDQDPRKVRDDVVKALRADGIRRTTKVRVVRTVTTSHVVGEEITV